MPVVNITVRDVSYSIVCDNGQENHLHNLAAKLDQRISDLAASMGKGSSDVRLFVIAALMLEDELTEIKAKLASMPKPIENGEESGPTIEEQVDVTVSKTMEAIAERLEKIALQWECV